MTVKNCRCLIHYVCVNPKLRQENVGTAIMKTVMNLRDYHKKEIMAVTSLHSSYRGDGSQETMVHFLETFDSKGIVKN